MVAHIIWDDGAQFESDIFYFVQTMRSRVQISVPRLQNGVDLVTHFPHKEGYVGSNPTSATVTVADLAMRRIVKKRLLNKVKCFQLIKKDCLQNYNAS